MDTSAPLPEFTQPLADIQISMALNGIAMQLASLRQMGASPAQCREVYSRLLVEMSNAAEIDMYGKTFIDPAKGAPQEVGIISELLETTPTPYRNKLFLSPFERFSVGSGALIVQQDANGQDHVLLVRGGKNPNEWGLPGGYMDPVPSSNATLPDRLDPEARSVQDEALAAHKKIDVPDMQAPMGETLPISPLPTSDATRNAYREEYNRLLKEQGWQAAYAAMNDGDYLRAMFAGADVALPAQPVGNHAYDLTRQDNIRRETKEETGLNVEALEREGRAKLTLVSTELGLGIGSRGRRPNAIDSMFLIDLGAGAALPPLKPEDKEIVETAWVPLSAIQQNTYVVQRDDKDALPIGADTIPFLENALHTLLAERMQRASGGRVESLANLRAQSQSMTAHLALENDLLAATSMQAANSLPEGVLPSLMGQHGQKLLQGLTLAAATVGVSQDMPVVVKPERPPLSAPTPWVDKITQMIAHTAIAQSRL